MSHFSVLVTGISDMDSLAKALQPFHEFECTGEDDQYVQNIDQLPEARQTYETDAVPRVKGPDGTLYRPRDTRFYLPASAENLSVEERESLWNALRNPGPVALTSPNASYTFRHVPAGYEEVEVPPCTCMTLPEWIEYQYSPHVISGTDTPDITGKHKYGWVRIVDGEVAELVNRTNPNKKWDWWQAGGRFQSRMRVKPDAPTESIRCDERGEVQFLRRSALDVEEMRAVGAMRAETRWDKARQILGDVSTFSTWQQCRNANPTDLDAARKMYHAQPQVETFREEFGPFDSPDDFLVTREEYIASAVDAAFSCFAVLENGEWHQQGEMGWFGMSSDEVPWDQWRAAVRKLVDEMPEDTWLTVVDCHI